jgi:hypothetical protein
MTFEKQFPGEAPTPQAATLHDALRYQFNETARRSIHSTDGLTNADCNADPGHGAWSVGMILKHHTHLIRFMIDTLRKDGSADLIRPDIGVEGDWNLANLCAWRETLNERWLEVFNATDADALMATRPDLPPEPWAEWPVLMRMLRPLTDIATHVGQVNYARRQLGMPVNPN